MSDTVLITKGTYAKSTITNKTFTMILSPRVGKKGMYVTVEGTPLGYPNRNLRIMLENESDAVYIAPSDITPAVPAVADPVETDEEIMDRMRDKFGILDGMTIAAIEGNVRGLIVTGPPGIGKSFGVEMIIESMDVMSKLELHEGAKPGATLGVEKGSASAIGLYQLLYQYSRKGSVLVLDDSDTILYDETSLNLLKAALDSGKKRKLAWRSESRALENSGTPESYEFEGAIIFITNLDFEKTRGKIGDHLKAIISRCHYLDMGIHDSHEKFLRCKQVVRDGMLGRYDLEPCVEVEILDYIETNQKTVRELSLRMVTKVADLVKMDPNGWRTYADSTCLRNS